MTFWTTHRKKNFSLFLFALKKQTHRYDTTDVVKRVKKLLKGHEDLLDGFNCFLPDVSSKICVFFILSSLLLLCVDSLCSRARFEDGGELTISLLANNYRRINTDDTRLNLRRYAGSFVFLCFLCSLACVACSSHRSFARLCVCVRVHTFINKQTLSKQHRSKKKNRTSNERTRRKRSNKTNSNNIAKSKKRKRTRTNRR